MRCSGWSLARQTKPDVSRLSQGTQARVGSGEQALNSTDGCGEQGKSMGDMGSGFKLVLIVRESEIIPLPSLSLLGTQ